jgi:crossover junction endodeoxyribonuclease RuvC
MISLGIDLSTSKTGLVLLQASLGVPKVLAEKLIVGKGTGMARVRSVITEIMEFIHGNPHDCIVIEGYSLNTKNSASIIPLVEIGGALRLMFHLDGLKWLDPRATELKKFVTGKGNSPKEIVMMNVLKRWGYEAQDNNMADAYGCACVGLAFRNKLQGATLEQRKLVGGLEFKTQ